MVLVGIQLTLPQEKQRIGTIILASREGIENLFAEFEILRKVTVVSDVCRKMSEVVTEGKRSEGGE